jgi:membrane associated rhomboid family serine protease
MATVDEGTLRVMVWGCAFGGAGGGALYGMMDRGLTFAIVMAIAGCTGGLLAGLFLRRKIQEIQNRPVDESN